MLGSLFATILSTPITIPWLFTPRRDNSPMRITTRAESAARRWRDENEIDGKENSPPARATRHKRSSAARQDEVTAMAALTLKRPRRSVSHSGSDSGISTGSSLCGGSPLRECASGGASGKNDTQAETSDGAVPSDRRWILRLIEEYSVACGMRKEIIHDDKFNEGWELTATEDTEFPVNAVLARGRRKNGKDTFVVAWGGTFCHPNWFEETDAKGAEEQIAHFLMREAAVTAAIREKQCKDKWRVATAREYMPYNRGWVAEQYSLYFPMCVLQAMEQITINKMMESSCPSVPPLFVVDLLSEPRPLTDRTCRLPFGVVTRTPHNENETRTSKNNLRIKLMTRLSYSVAGRGVVERARRAGDGGQIDWKCYCKHGKERMRVPRDQLVVRDGRLWFLSQSGSFLPPTQHLSYMEDGVQIKRILVECCGSCECDPATCSNRIIQAGRKEPLVLFFEGGNEQWGVRAARDIQPFTFVTEYIGEVRTSEECEEDEGCDSSYIFEMMQDDDHPQLVVDASRGGNESRLFNHSCDPNMAAIPVVVDRDGLFHHRLAFFTIKPVKQGEKLTFAYSDAYTLATRGKGAVRARCNCHSHNCRKWI